MTYNVFGGTLSLTQSINQSDTLSMFDFVTLLHSLLNRHCLPFVVFYSRRFM